MGAIIQNNLWGKAGGLDQQRNDLWRVDFGVATTSTNPANPTPSGETLMLGSLSATFKNVYDAKNQSRGVRLTNSLKQYATSGVLAMFPQTVTLPEVRTNASPYVGNDNAPVQLPDYDEPIQGVRLTMRVETPANGDMSAIIEFMNCWRDAARAGRSFDGTALPLLTRGAGGFPVFPAFRFSVLVQMYKGAAGLVAPGLALDTSVMPMVPTTTVLLSNAWCSSVQVSELTYTGTAEGCTIASLIYPDSVQFSAAAGNVDLQQMTTAFNPTD